MTEYRLRKSTVTNKRWSTVDIPDDAIQIQVDYEEPVGMEKPSHRATVRYLEPVDEDEVER